MGRLRLADAIREEIMGQIAKIIDITRTYVPVDPNAFPENMHGAGAQDYPEKMLPAAPYEGYNFMPTSYGYRSYFGTNSILNVDAVPSNVDHIFIVQSETFENILVALCEDGIWTKRGEAVGAWAHEVVLIAPPVGMHYNWTYCPIGNEVFFYRAGEALYWKMSPTTTKYTPDGMASAVTGLSASFLAITGYATSLPAGTYNYKVAYKDATGRISAPSAAFPLVIGAAGYPTVKWNRLATAVGGYRLYRIDPDNSVKYYDVPQVAGATVYFDDSKVPLVGVLPDTNQPTQYTEYAISPATPSFLNMQGQQGIFNAGGKLGFWDSENSVAWSSIDDFSDFTPDLETLAGSAIFVDVKGRITAIHGHGSGFIIYATNSIVYIRQDVTATLQWSPLPISTNSGVAFPQQVAIGNPDSVHFAWTTTGLYRIKEGAAELLIPEVTDFLQEADGPVALKIFKGRYLAINLIDPAYINGLVQFITNIIPDTVYSFPGGTALADVVDAVTLTGTKVCANLGGIGAGNLTEQQADGEAARVAAGTPAAGTSYTPVWTAYFSNTAGGNAANIDWGNDPVATADVNGVEVNMCPKPKTMGLLSGAGETLANKTAVTGAEAYTDGHWTIERFIAVQEAIWKAEEDGRQAFINKILNRASATSKVENNVADFVAGETTNLATIGTYIGGSSGRNMGMNRCSFYYTRFIDKAITVKRVRVQRTTKETIANQGTLMWASTVVGGVYNTADEAAAASWPGKAYVLGSLIQDAAHPFYAAHDQDSNFANLVLWRVCTISPLSSTAINSGCAPTINRTTSVNAYNTGRVEAIAPIADTARLILTGWEYTDKTGTKHTIPALGVCDAPTAPATSGPGLVTMSGKPIPPVIADNGTICSKPFDPVTIPAIQPNVINWPDQSVTLPGGSFLLQKGSIGPIYPTYVGALVYDLHLKKWGKMKLNYTQLLDYSPINSASGDTIDEETFGIEAGALLPTGKISLFDNHPVDSYIKYGKIGYYRLGMTDAEEVKIAFRTASTGAISLETSLDGRTIETALGSAESYTDSLTHTMGCGSVGRWHNIKISGNYDIANLEFRGTVQGRR
jgi:hypothetical protein